ncbi:PREDICTED: syndetin-like [Acropora digitifera]|uniref:syndetin-like n=1 Tax=Acropora digitifera TaxID=70779 RepID=UPI00077A30D1|nr:PREDICTED: syndetin-like [Acropora digitifera]
MDLQESLHTASSICDRGRRQLDRAKRGVSVGGLGILAKHRKKQHLLILLDSLRTIKTLQRTDVRLKEMLEEEDYPGAITLCLECEKAAQAFKHYSCISELSSNLQETLIDIEFGLDTHGSRVTENMLFIDSQEYSLEPVSEDSFQHLHFEEQCKKVGTNRFTPCLLDLCKTLWSFMLSYHQIYKWHELYDPAMHLSSSEQEEPSAEAAYNKNYIQQKLDHGLNRIWKVRLIEFRFMKHQHPDVKTHRRTASGTVHTSDTGFFSRYSANGNPFDDVYVEDEVEDVLAENGEILDGDVNENDKRSRGLSQDDDEEDDEDEDIPDELKLDYVDEKTGEIPSNRFETSAHSRKHQKFLSKVPCITNTTLNVLRVFGKYMQMMNVLKPIAFDVVICMSQLFDYYLFAVASFFAPEVMVDGSAHGLSIKLRTSLKRIADNLIYHEQGTLQLMTGVRWDIRDIMSQHNAYVDMLVRELQVFSMRLAQLAKQIPVPQDARTVLWDHCVRLVNRTFVEGFASAKKCSNEGRALMQLDFQQYLMKLERLTDLRPIPDREFVETYVKAFYLTENEMERWIREHKEYSTKQLTSLVTCGVGSHVTKKGKQKLLSIIEDMERSKSR